MAFATNVSEKRKSTFPSAIQVKTRRKAINIEENLGVIGQLEKHERIDKFIHVVK
jgi:hypothetical protein